jgi:putative membrane protein
MPPGVHVEPGHGEHELAAAYSALGVVGWTLLLVLLAGAVTTLLMWRSGRLRQLSPNRGRPADDQARQILAERFARGDISSEEFLERCATLNWTPGIDRPKPGRKRA